MDDDLRDRLEQAMAPYITAAPGHWIRIVLWCGRLLDTDGSTAGFTFPCVAVTWDGGTAGQQYVVPPATEMLGPTELDSAVAGKPEEGWTMLRVELDRDGDHRFAFSHEPARPLDDSATDTFWDDVHEYLDRNREAVADLVARLGTAGLLPGAQDVTPVDPRTLPPSERPGASAAEKESGLLGRLFGRG